MLLQLPERENETNPKLKHAVSTTAKTFAERLNAYLNNKGFETFSCKLQDNNDLLSHLPAHSPAHIPKTTTIRKKTTPEDTAEKQQTSTYSKKKDKQYLFKPEDEILMTITRLARPRALAEFEAWLNELEKHDNIPKTWIQIIREHLPDELLIRAKTVTASQTNLRTNKNWVLQKTGGRKSNIPEISVHAPLELLENFYKFQECNLIRGAELDENALMEFKRKAGQNLNTPTMQDLGNNTNLQHLGIIGLRLEKMEQNPKLTSPTTEEQDEHDEKTDEEEHNVTVRTEEKDEEAETFLQDADSEYNPNSLSEDESSDSAAEMEQKQTTKKPKKMKKELKKAKKELKKRIQKKQKKSRKRKRESSDSEDFSESESYKQQLARFRRKMKRKRWKKKKKLEAFEALTSSGTSDSEDSSTS